MLVRQPLISTSHIVRSLDSHYHSSKLLTEFFIRNKSKEAVLIISKISQMNQIRKNIVLTSDICRVISERSGVYFDRSAGEHFDQRNP